MFLRKGSDGRRAVEAAGAAREGGEGGPARRRDERAGREHLRRSLFTAGGSLLVSGPASLSPGAPADPRASWPRDRVLDLTSRRARAALRPATASPRPVPAATPTPRGEGP
jgi:hypothetical protein